eukprot:12546064-Prorocentrum_lima.AAC.1
MEKRGREKRGSFDEISLHLSGAVADCTETTTVCLDFKETRKKQESQQKRKRSSRSSSKARRCRAAGALRG